MKKEMATSALLVSSLKVTRLTPYFCACYIIWDSGWADFGKFRLCWKSWRSPGFMCISEEILVW